MLGDLLRRFGLAEPAERPDPALPPFQGGMIGFFGYDLAPRIERLPRRLAARLAPARYPPGTLRHGRHRRRAHGHGRALGLGPDRRGTPGRPAALPRLAQGPRSRVPIAAAGADPDLGAGTADQLVRPRDLSRDRAPRAGIHRGRRRLPGQPVAAIHGPGTSGAARPLPAAQGGEPGARSRRSSTGTTWRSSRPARSGSTRRAATCWSRGRSRGRGRAAAIPTTTRGSPPSCVASPKDRAELTMIVDLERNDLGRVCRVRLGRRPRPD